MYNHARTLLLNLTHENDSDHIPSSFVGMELPTVLEQIDGILFTKGISDTYRVFLTDVYLKIIKSANLYDDLLAIDKRETWNLDTDRFFKVGRISKSTSSNSSFGAIVTGRYTPVETNRNVVEKFVIAQVDDSYNVYVHSAYNNLYLGSSSFKALTPEAYTLLTIDTSTNSSGSHDIFNTGLSFQITSDGISAFTDTSNKTFEFTVEAPYVFDFNKLYAIAKSSKYVENLLNTSASDDYLKYVNMWRRHPNPVYRMAGLLVLYILKLNEEYKS